MKISHSMVFAIALTIFSLSSATNAEAIEDPMPMLQIPIERVELPQEKKLLTFKKDFDLKKSEVNIKLDRVKKIKEEAEKVQKEKETLEQEVERLKLEVQTAELEVAAKKEAERLAAEEAARIAAQPIVVQPQSVGQVSQSLPQVTQRMSGNSSNSYAVGYCTWYVKNVRPDIGSFWGNANQWLYSAQAAGYSTGYIPSPGAIAVANGENHVAYVESVSGNMVNISEMNYAGGLGQIHRRSVPANHFTYIY